MSKYNYNNYISRRAIGRFIRLVGLIGIPLLILVSVFGGNSNKTRPSSTEPTISQSVPIHYLTPKYEEGDTYVVVNNNIPLFTNEDISSLEVFEEYTELDHLNRVGPANAILHQDMMPSEARGDISKVKPTGWRQKKVKGNYLYHRCHLIGFQLTGQNDNPLNLMTGTRFFNVQGMLPIENYVADYIENNPDAYVRYRVTPLFTGNNLLADGVFMEGFSIQDNGEDVQFHVFIPNYLPGVELNYLDGSVASEFSILEFIQDTVERVREILE